MKDSTILNLDQGNVKAFEENENDLQFIISFIVKNWYWFVLAVIVSVFAVRFHIKHTMPIYRTSATILIDETEDRDRKSVV